MNIIIKSNFQFSVTSIHYAPNGELCIELSSEKGNEKNITLYASPYLVANNNGYTKHYYAGTERVCASIGNGNLNDSGNFISQEQEISSRSISLYDACLDAMQHRLLAENSLTDITDGCGDTLFVFPDFSEMAPTDVDADTKVMTDLFENAMATYASTTQQHEEPFYYHSDHLGSASWITDANGQPVQHLQYLPFGESFINQHTSGYEERFTFTGKEKDSESRFYYFGARYYDCDLSGLFLSVDPMSDKYPSLSPYAYCAWNPIKLVDPDGNTVRVADKQSRLNIKYSLTKKESRYIKYDKKGCLDVKRLNRCKSNSVNFNALRTLAQSKREYVFSTESFHKDIYNEIDLTNPYKTEGIKNYGVTLMPGNVQDPSPDQNVYVITSSNLTIEDQVSNLAHEGYGHAFFFELSQNNSDVNPNHNYQREIVQIYNEELQRNVPTVIRCETNTALKQQIDAAVQEAKQNYQLWRE